MADATRGERRGWLRRRFSRDQYLGLHLTLGMVLCLAMLGLFVVVARSVVGEGRVIRADEAVGQALEEHRGDSPFLRHLFLAVTQAGDFLTLTLLAVLVALLLFRRRQRLLALVWITALAGGGLLDSALKVAFARDRPDFRDPLVTETSKSFPSGHSMGSMVAFGFLGYLLALSLPPRQAVAACAGLALLVLLIGFSRIYLGAHYLSDVIGGFAVGACWVAAVISGIEVVRRRRHHARRQAAGRDAVAG